MEFRTIFEKKLSENLPDNTESLTAFSVDATNRYVSSLLVVLRLETVLTFFTSFSALTHNP